MRKGGREGGRESDVSLRLLCLLPTFSQTTEFLAMVGSGFRSDITTSSYQCHMTSHTNTLADVSCLLTHCMKCIQ